MQLVKRSAAAGWLLLCLGCQSADAWSPLFDGASLDGWTVKIRGLPLGEDPYRTFRVEDGVLRVGYENYDGPFGGRFGHLFHDAEFSHYLLRVEYRFVGEQAEGGPGWAWRNSGVMIHGQRPETMTVEQDFPVSIEVQLLGGDGEHERTNANLCTPGTNVVMDSQLVTRHCVDSNSKTCHGDDWYTVIVEVRGGEVVRHFVDGELVLEYREPQLDPRDANALGLMVGESLILDHGTISLQWDSQGVGFGRVDVRRLKVVVAVGVGGLR
ncbi:MAG: DUF1080 domain-containing protein [Planctomycetes bacterium]|nr:DUF1080 domain-containing protein [Planctomycetota bacterium]